jgi:hypothetical protein
VVYQWVYLIKTCEIWILDESQLLDDKVREGEREPALSGFLS